MFGILAARYVVRLKRFQGLIDGLFTLPMILPPTVVGFILLLIFGKNGWIGKLLGLMNVYGGVYVDRRGDRLHGGIVPHPVPHGEGRVLRKWTPI